MGHTFQIILAGCASVGKTTWLKRMAPLRFSTTRGEINFVTQEVIGVPRRRDDGLILMYDMTYRENYYDARSADGVILMFDTTRPSTYDILPALYDAVVHPGVPAVLVGNKCDLVDRGRKDGTVIVHQNKQMFYYDISATTNYQTEKPLLYLARRLLNDPDLDFFPS